MGTWITEGFEAFRAGTFDNAGQNLYVSRAGVLQRIHLFDINQDGYLDLVFCNAQDHFESPPAYVYQDVFGSPTRTELPSDGSGTGAVYDLNGNGLHDLIIGMDRNGATSQLHAFVYFGSESGLTPQFHTRLPAPSCRSVAAGDFNGDGKPDLVFASEGKLRLFLQNDIGWEPKRYVTVDVAASQIAAADLDGDGYCDLYVTRDNEPPIILWGGPDGLNSERSTLVTVPLDSSAANEEGFIASEMEGDVNAPPLACVLFLNDLPHLFVPQSKRALLIPVNGRDAFGKPLEFQVKGALAAAAGNVRGGEKKDIVFACSDFHEGQECSWVYFQTEAGYSETARIPLASTNACDIALGDLDSNGCDDIVLCQYRSDDNFSFHSLVYRSTPAGTGATPIQLATEGARRVFIAHSQPDDKPSLIFINRFARNAIGKIDPAIFWGAADGYRSDRVQYLSGQGCVTSLCADFNDDGRPDLLLVNSSENAMHLNPGSFIFYGREGGFSYEPDSTLPTYTPMAVVCGDINRDGYLDLIFTGFAHNEVVIFYGGPNGFDTENPERLYMEDDGKPCVEARRMLLADLNGDGWLDLVLTYITSDRCYVLWGGPDGFSTQRRQVLSVYRASAPHAADLTGNGYLDLIIGSHTPSPTGPHDSFLHIYWNGPEGLRDDRRMQLPIAAALNVLIADYNNDGYLDIFVPNYHNGRDRDIPSLLFWGGPDGFREDRKTPIFTHSAAGGLAADFNEDGYIDIAVPNHKTWGDHIGESYILWNGPAGFNEERKTSLPTKGPHGITHIGPGNQRDRGPEEYYLSAPYKMPDGAQVQSMEWQAELPIKTWVRGQIRTAADEQSLQTAPWRKPGESSGWCEDKNAKSYAPSTNSQEASITAEITSGPWVQFRLALGAVNGGNTPRVRSVTVHYGFVARTLLEDRR